MQKKTQPERERKSVRKSDLQATPHVLGLATALILSKSMLLH